jgi:DNA polymerase
LRDAARDCRGCDLCEIATQCVFGEGPPDARVVFVGEQPGDQEDLTGRPFVGPSGQVFDEALAAVGMNRTDVYVTNAVKHFRFEMRGKKRIHQRASARQIDACRPWVEQELKLINPPVLVLLGSTAAQSLIGRHFKITRDRGKFFPSSWSASTIATFHPSALLRIPDDTMRAEAQQHFVSDLHQVAEQLQRISPLATSRASEIT